MDVSKFKPVVGNLGLHKKKGADGKPAFGVSFEAFDKMTDGSTPKVVAMLSEPQFANFIALALECFCAGQGHENPEEAFQRLMQLIMTERTREKDAPQA